MPLAEARPLLRRLLPHWKASGLRKGIGRREILRFAPFQAQGKQDDGISGEGKERFFVVPRKRPGRKRRASLLRNDKPLDFFRELLSFGVIDQDMEKLTGIHAVREALAAGRPLQTVIVGREHHGDRLAEIVSLAKRNGVPVRFEDRAQLDRAAERVATRELWRWWRRDLPSLLRICLRARARRSGATGLLVILDGVEDPQNLGAIIRTALAAGAGGVIIPERRAAGLTEAAARASAKGPWLTCRSLE